MHPMVGNQFLQLNTYQPLPTGGDIIISVFDYYISELKIYHDGGTVLDKSDTVYLIEPNNYTLSLGIQPFTQIDSISFLVGVKKSLNTINGANAVDISSYPENHPLSFQSPSMFWGWSAGYMHMIISAAIDNTSDGVDDAYFELHNLGFNNVHTIKLNVIPTETNAQQTDIHLRCNIDQWIRGVNFNTVGILHGDIGENAQVLANVNVYPVFNQDQTASLIEVENHLLLNWKKSNGTFEFSYQNLKKGMVFQISTLEGKILYNQKISEENGKVIFNANEKILMLSISDKEGRHWVYTKKIWNE